MTRRCGAEPPKAKFLSQFRFARDGLERCRHALPFPPAIHRLAHGLKLCVPTWPLHTLIIVTRASWRVACAEAKHLHLSAITELDARENRSGRRPALTNFIEPDSDTPGKQDLASLV